MKTDKKVKVLNKSTAKKRPSSKKSNKKTSLVSRFQGLSRRGQLLLFASVFAVIGGGYMLYQSFASDGLPDGANEIVVSYEIGMNHTLPEDNFPSGPNSTGLLLYGNGLLLCSQDTVNMASMSAEEMAKMPDNGLMQRQLTRDEVRAFVDNLKSNGYSAAAADKKIIIPLAGKAHSILVNTSEGATTVYGMGGESNPSGFTQAESFLKVECNKATTAYTPDDVYAETITLANDNPDAKNTSGQLPAGFDVDQTANEHKSKNVTGKEAKALKTAIPHDQKTYTTADGKVVRARVIPKIPEYKDPKPKVESSKGKVSAAAAYKVRFIAVIPQGVNTPSWATSASVQASANSIRSWYYEKTGKYFDFDSADALNFKVVRGAKTIAQYKSCPAAQYPVITANNVIYPFNCTNDSSAVNNNMLAEFHKPGVSTVILSAINPVPISSTQKIGGWGWQGEYDDHSGYVSNVGLTGVVFAGETDAAYAQKRVRAAAAHEFGHNLGAGHVCSGTLMWKGGSCPMYDAWNATKLDSGQAANIKTYSKFFAAPTSTPPPPYTGYGMMNGTSPAIYGNTVVFQANTGHLYKKVIGGGVADLNLGMAGGTSPAIWDNDVMFQANTGNLFDKNLGGGAVDLGLGMAGGTSPGIYGNRVVFQANTGSLYMRVLGGGTTNFSLGMAGGTSPAIYGDNIVFQANTGNLFRRNLATGNTVNLNLGMAGGTSPAIWDNNVVFQANTGHLFLRVLGGGTTDLNLGMAGGTSPDIYGDRVVFQANTGHLFLKNISSGGIKDLGLGMMAGTSPSIWGDEIVFQANTGVLWHYNIASGSGGIL